ncbi:hypothetical protein [Arthrobacter bambusae]|uniref:hypothetical protein n=1 Tax=Arthrobacter bambusae TaxID=1338426 RepID=UPI00277F7834|nr:hypothetical protein [Arthrobacter bambusae]MDQ0029947.1 GNAT superfamily N-acetyltransferase [Arthrobacter bambusae]MDQ0097535.1 GNAT superfamily N-acetyltransferase [Arthrobacter bambusae]
MTTAARSVACRGVRHDPDDYPMFWTVKVKGRVWDGEDDGGDGTEVSVGEAELYIVPDAGTIDLFLTLDAVNQEVANVGEMLTINRPDLIDDMSLGGDLMILSWLKVAPKFRGNKLGHVILNAILSTIGRSSVKVILEATPALTDNGPMEGSPEHVAGKAALRRYWERFGFQPAHGDYLVFDGLADDLD